MLVLAAALAFAAQASAQRRMSISVSSYTTLLETRGHTATFRDRNTGIYSGVKLTGTDFGTEVHLDSKTTMLECVASFPGIGTIKIKGVIRPKGGGNFDVAIIGGSGMFEGARGVLHVRGANKLAVNGELSVNEYELRLPDAAQ